MTLTKPIESGKSDARQTILTEPSSQTESRASQWRETYGQKHYQKLHTINEAFQLIGITGHFHPHTGIF